MSRQVWSMHGLRVRSDDVPLDAAPVAVGDGADEDDVTVVLDARGDAVPSRTERPPGRTLATVDVENLPWLTVVEPAEVPSGAHQRRVVDVHFHGVGSIRISPDRREMRLTLADSADPAIAPVLVSGTGVSVLLTLLGHPVLHASAVTVETADGPRALAFLGRSGMGKSTVATLVCRDGGRLLTDDVLRADLAGPDSVRVWPGATATRLRPAAATLGTQVATRIRQTADGRVSASLDLAPDEDVPLQALVIPQPDRQRATVGVTTLDGVAAVMAMAGFPRLSGWTDPATSGAAHLHWGELARRVPVHVARLPWGPPFRDGEGAEIVRRVLAAGVVGLG